MKIEIIMHYLLIHQIKYYCCDVFMCRTRRTSRDDAPSGAPPAHKKKTTTMTHSSRGQFQKHQARGLATQTLREDSLTLKSWPARHRDEGRLP